MNSPKTMMSPASSPPMATRPKLIRLMHAPPGEG
jgi:hypothetical protein